jgi:hypothetical protein
MLPDNGLERKGSLSYKKCTWFAIVLLCSAYIIFSLKLTPLSIKDIVVNSFGFNNSNNVSSPTLETEKVINVFPSNTMLINKNLLHYSTVISWSGPNSSLVIEALLYFKVTPSHTDLRCAVRLNKTFVLFKPVLSMIEIERSGHGIYRVNCTLESSDLEIEDFYRILVGVVDSRKYSVQNQDDILYHIANFCNKTLPKKKTLMNCVHNMHAIDEERSNEVITWLRILQGMGYDKVRIYAVHYENPFVLNFTKLFPGYVEMIPHEYNITRACSIVKPEDQQSCIDTFGGHLGILGLREKTSTNDCLMNYKHVYKYMTNFDIDEIIFARRLETGYHQKIDVSNPQKCSQVYENLAKEPFNMYDYCEALTKKFGPFAFYRFENYIVIKKKH